MAPERPSGPDLVVRTALLLAWCAGVWYLSDRSDPGDTVGILTELPDWLLHGIEYAVGGFLARRVLAPVLPSWGSVAAVLFCLAWAGLDEWHQSFVPGRDASLSDVFADAVGSVIGVAVHALLDRRGGG
jgi:VanZ family protein